jgi:shikimate dehydrogenase
MKINAKTRITGLIGYPVEHSFSPDMHNAAFEELGLNFCYIAMAVSPERLPDAVEGIRSLGFHGINVTVPHKQNIMPLLDDIEDEAQFIGAVNTVKNEGGRLKGFNTDGRGFIESVREAGIDLTGRNVFIVGAGGAARAIGYYISRMASVLNIFDIDSDKASMLADDLGKIEGKVNHIQNLKEAMSADIIINATPLGLKNGDPLPFDTDMLESRQIVCDLIYWDTELLRRARSRGCRTMNGLGMLLWQGAIAFQIWTGISPPVELMRKVLLEKIGAKG